MHRKVVDDGALLLQFREFQACTTLLRFVEFKVALDHARNDARAQEPVEWMRQPNAALVIFVDFTTVWREDVIVRFVFTNELVV